MTVTIEIQNQLEPEPGNLPDNQQILHWAQAALSEMDVAELTIRITDDNEIAELNSQYRNKSKPTNVLSFPADIPAELNLPLLGDIVICASVVEKEADEQNKSLEAHWAHMVVHGTLHLLGYDHIEDQAAEEMETKEIEILNKLGFANPYLLRGEV